MDHVLPAPISFRAALMKANTALFVFAAIMFLSNGVLAEVTQNGCNMHINNSEIKAPVTNICYIQERRSTAAGGRAVSAEDIKENLYEGIMTYLGQELITRGKPQFKGKLFKKVYSDAQRPKAIAVCIDWTKTTPLRVKLGDGNKRRFQFITGAGDCHPSSAEEAGQCAIAECRASAKCPARENCELLDVNDQNKLTPPQYWLDRYK
ncbi:MAG: hypothetical protein QOD99_316 [Chthoniobacter sp.]|nr:hypothetical protein [Chthoniobacter sp.]